LDYITPGKAIEARDRLSEVERMIKALIKSLENKGIMDSKKMPREPLDPLNP
jgi:hypothetical protein